MYVTQTILDSNHQAMWNSCCKNHIVFMTCLSHVKNMFLESHRSLKGGGARAGYIVKTKSFFWHSCNVHIPSKTILFAQHYLHIEEMLLKPRFAAHILTTCRRCASNHDGSTILFVCHRSFTHTPDTRQTGFLIHVSLSVWQSYR